MITFENVAYSYRNGSGIKNVDFHLKQGEFAFLIGPTGSGKTTIMRLIYLELIPDSGRVTVLGLHSTRLKPRKIPRLRRRIGMIFQDYHLLSDRNLFENVALPLHIIGTNRSEVDDRVLAVLDEVGLRGKEKLKPYELSGGEQQRACVARALVKDPDIILADEPTGNLDPVAAFELVDLLERLNEEGKAVLMASHNYNLIKGRGHRILEIQDGRLRNQ
jgi:cell division transport system ATP-binding protein